MPPFVSRAGSKLDHALTTFNLTVTGLICADLGCSTGGFTDCLLQRGAAKVYAVDTGYGVLDWKLRKDPRVIVMERTNAMHVALPEPAQLITIDVGWTRQHSILPNVARLISPDGIVISLIKPHYQVDPSLLRKGILPPESVDAVVLDVRRVIEALGWTWQAETRSPIRGSGGNIETLVYLRPPA